MSDYMSAVPGPHPALGAGRDFYALGTDGWGMSDTRGALRRHFLVDAESIVVQTLSALAKRGEVSREVVAEAINRYRLLDPAAADAGNTGRRRLSNSRTPRGPT